MIETKTLFHRNDPETSEAAADKMIKSGALSKQENEIYNDITRYVIDCAHKDFTAKELALWLIGNHIKTYFTIQRRLSGLHNKGKIERTGEKRDGCAVWRLTI